MSVSHATAIPSISVSSAFETLPGVSSTISAAPRRSTATCTACWKTVIPKRCAHQRVHPWVWGSTQSSTITGDSTISTSSSASRISIWNTSSSATTT